MAGHSHSENIKHHKKRQDDSRSQLFVKLRKQLERMIKSEGKFTEKILSLARKNKFPKEKLYQIQKKIELEKKTNENETEKYFFWEALYGIFFCCDKKDLNQQENFENLSLRMIPLKERSAYFDLTYYLMIDSCERKEILKNNLSKLISMLKSEITYFERDNIIHIQTSTKETIEEIKSSINNMVDRKNIKIISIWKPLFRAELNNRSEKEYFEKLINLLKGTNCTININ